MIIATRDRPFRAGIGRQLQAEQYQSRIFTRDPPILFAHPEAGDFEQYQDKAKISGHS